MWHPKIYYIAKYEEQQCYGGPEEGGWWYNAGEPVWKYSIPIPFFEELSYAICRWFNDREYSRQKKTGAYGNYTSTVSYRYEFYGYQHSDTFKPQPYPEARPHYE